IGGPPDGLVCVPRSCVRQHNAVTAVSLRLVERRVSGFERCFWRSSIRGKCRNTHGNGYAPQRLASEVERDFPGRSTQLLGPNPSGFLLRVGKNHRKFLSSIPADYVFFSQKVQQKIAQTAKHHVSSLMAKAIVELFEVIDIKHHQGER